MDSPPTAGIPVGPPQSVFSAQSAGKSTVPPVIPDADLAQQEELQRKLSKADSAAALPLEGHHETLALEQPQTGRKRRWIIPLVILLVVLIATIIGLAVGLTQSKKNEQNLEKGPPPAPTPTVSASKLEAAKNYVIDWGYSSVTAFNNPSSPQNKALEFMAHDEEAEIPDTPEPQWAERYALAVVYYATSGPSWSWQLDFLTHDLDHCNWFWSLIVQGGSINIGASCNNDRRVTYLSLVTNGLLGTLPPELGILSEVDYLNLIFNPSLTGPIPRELESMTNLAYFDAEGCSLTGSIPSWIGKWSMLETLALTDNAMTGILPSGLFQLTDLRMLFLDGNSFSGDLSNMNGLTSLSYAYLDRNAFSQNIDDTFLVGLRQLTQLDISENNFVGTVPVHLFDDKLEVFDVNDNFLTSFPDDISNQTLRPLWFLTIFNNPIEGPFPSSILNLPNLAHFDATTTKLTGAMPTELGSLTKLSYLFLANTKFLPGPIPDVYQQLTLLADLSLKKSSRTGSIPTWVGLLDRLVLLDLDYNDFSGSVPSEIGDMASLTFLLLNRNSLTGPVPTQVGSLIDLQLIAIDHNSVTGDLQPLCDAAMNLQIAAADCGDINNTTTRQITCGCCNICCDDAAVDERCNDLDLLTQFDPSWMDGYIRPPGYNFVQDYNITRHL